MIGTANRLALIVPGVVAPLSIAISMSPAVSKAAECGDGTVYDAPSDTCVVTAQPVPPPALPPPPPPSDLPPTPPPPALPPPPPAWNGPRPYVSVGICAPIPFIRICAGI